MLAGTTKNMRRLAARVGSLLPRRRARSDDRRRIVTPWRDDALRTYPSAGLTPARALALLHAADAGTPAQQFELYREMLDKWPRLAAVEATRRLALTGLPWEISADESRPLHPLAEAAADDCREILGRIDAMRDALDHMARAIGFGVSVIELVWEKSRLVDLVPVPWSRLLADAHEPWRLCVRTQRHATHGVPLDARPAKWLVHRPRPALGRNFDAGLLRSSLLLYLAQNLSLKDWLVYSQIAGMPIRIGRFEPGATEDERKELFKMLSTVATDAVAVISRNVDIQMLETGRAGEAAYRTLQDYCNTEITILWLGQHLTTDIRNSGSRAAAEIHDRVREDLLVDDIADESQTIRRNLLTPLVQARFGPEAPVPHFRRSLIQSVDTRVLAETLAIAVGKLGLRVPSAWVHRALGIPEPAADEPVLEPGDQP